jgi:hypothetical protein
MMRVVAIGLMIGALACGGDAREVGAGGACTASDACIAGRCDWPAGHACGSDGTPGMCVAGEPTVCPALVDPVCGCDDHTYANACYAALARVAVASHGACP